MTLNELSARESQDERTEPDAVAGPRPGGGGVSRLWRFLGPRKIGAVYLWILIIIAFSIDVPQSFLQWATVTNILNQYSISGLMALAVVVPLAAGLFDLSVGYTMGLTGTMVAWLLANGFSVASSVVIALALGAFVGLANGFIVVFAGIDSLIATLGTGSIIGAITVGISHNETIVKNVGGSFSRDIATISLGHVTLPVLYMVVVMVILGVVLEQTVVGRLWYAAGFDLEVTRLVGVRVRGLRISAFVLSGLIAGVAGIALTARIGASSPDVGPSYLLPAFSAAFLGATQFRDGRFNAWGAVLATLLLGTGEFGLLVAGAPVWAPDVFVGTALIASVGVTELGRRRSGGGLTGWGPTWWRTMWRRNRPSPVTG